MKLTPYFQNKKELHYKYKKTRFRGFSFKERSDQPINFFINSFT